MDVGHQGKGDAADVHISDRAFGDAISDEGITAAAVGVVTNPAGAESPTGAGFKKGTFDLVVGRANLLFDHVLLVNSIPLSTS